MKMTNAERLLGIMLAEIMEEMNLNREIDPSFIKAALINHDDWSISWKYSCFHDEEPVSDEAVLETADILSMMSYIEHSVSKLDPAEAAEFADDDVLQFRGFDGNNDRHHGIARTMMNDLERFTEFKDRPLNSHSQSTLQTYRRMKPVYDQELRGTHGRGLSAEALRAVRAAAAY